MEEKVIATVKSPTKGVSPREGRGFSLKEIEASGKSLSLLKELGVYVDLNRRTIHEENVELLKQLEKPKEEKKKERAAFVMKEKKPKKKKKKEAYTPKPKKTPEKKAPSKKEKAKKEKPAKKKEVAKPEETKKEELDIKLTDLAGLGPKTAEKLIELGVTDVEALCNEDPKELSMLVSGCSEEKISKWIDEGKELLNK